MSRDETKLKYLNPVLSNYFDMDLAEHSLRALTGKTIKGNDVDYRSPYFDGKPREDVLNAWQKILEPKLHRMEGLLEFENDLRGKVGPLSIEKPLSERLEDVEAYYDGIHLPSSPISNDAIDEVLRDWKSKVGGLRLRTPERTWEEMKKSTSAGAPTMGKKSRAVGDYGIPSVSHSGKSMIYPRLDGVYLPTAILGWRGQEGGLEDNDVKQRVIWMFPCPVSVEELRYYQPMIQAFQRFNLVPAWNGNDSVDVAMTKLFATKGANDLIICTDFTKFDQHFNPDMQQCAYKIIKALSNVDEWLDRIWPIKYNIPLLLDMDTMTTGAHGMGSGSGGTNADETLAHKTLQYEAALSAHSTLNPYSMCLGDDGCLSFPGIDLDAVLSSYTQHGLEMNESKQMVSKSEAVYLRRWYSRDYQIDGINRGVYSTYRALGKLMGYERLHDPDKWTNDLETIRALSIINNVQYHPVRDDFLQFCIKGDKYRLGLDIPGFFDRIAKVYESNELAQSFGSYTSHENTGINDWWVVRAIKSLA